MIGEGGGLTASRSCILSFLLWSPHALARPAHEPVTIDALKRAAGVTSLRADKWFRPTTAKQGSGNAAAGTSGAETPERGLDALRAVKPDRFTTSDAPLSYEAFYNPSVAPLKRYIIFDAVDAELNLIRAESPLRVVTVTGASHSPSASKFSARFSLRPSAKPVRIPSIAPTMSVVELTSDGLEPTILRDDVGHFFVLNRSQSEVRVKVVVEVDNHYLGEVTLPQDVALGVQAGEPFTELPPSVAPHVARLLRQIGIRSEMPFAAGLIDLVGYLRSFRSGQLPERTDDILSDIVTAKVGVCRHRAFAFMLLARGAGVPTRVVYNEAHAFVEIQLPAGGWMRIDLGGDAPSLTMRNTENRTLHRPKQDPFPTPAAYLETYSYGLLGHTQFQNVDSKAQLMGLPESGRTVAANGARGQAELGRSPDAFEGDRPSVDGGDGGKPVPVGATKVLHRSDTQAKLQETGDEGIAKGEPGVGLANEVQEQFRVQFDDEQAVFRVLRGTGDRMKVEGRVSRVVDGSPGRGVDIVLVAFRSEGKGRKLARLRTDQAGRFSFDVPISKDLGLGYHRLEVLSEARE